MSEAAPSAAVVPLRAPGEPHADRVAFLFTDIEGSSLKWLNHRAAMQNALRAHDEILRNAIAAHGGDVFKATTSVRRSIASRACLRSATAARCS